MYAAIFAEPMFFILFFDLNARFNVAIEGYCRYINLLAPAYKPFHHVVSYVLPRIGTSVRSFVLNGNWKPVMSTDTLAVLFGSQLSVIFPQLQRLTLKWFTGEDILLFLDGLENLSQLVVLDIRVLNGRTEDSLLTKILAANNGRLKYVSFDEDSASLNIPEGNETVSYPNIEELTVNVNLNRLFPRLFTFLPNVRRLYVTIDEETDRPEFNTAFAKLSPVVHLIDFQLRSRYPLWRLDEILDVLYPMSSLQKLTLDLSTNDKRIINGNNFVLLLPSSITQIHVCIAYYFSESDSKTDSLLASWPNHLPITCLLDEEQRQVLLYTVPLNLRSMVLPAEIGKQMSSGWKYLQHVEDLHIYSATSLAQVLLLLQHFRQLRSLTISTQCKLETCTYFISLKPTYSIIHNIIESLIFLSICIVAATSPTQPTVIKLPHLKKLTVGGISPLLCFVKAAPNLDHLEISFDCLKYLLDDEQTCHLLQQRITRLDIDDWSSTESDLLQHVSRIFSNLHQLIIGLNDSRMIMDSIIFAAIDNWYDKRLHWLFVNGSLSHQAKANLRQWLLDHTHLTTGDSFAVEHNDKWLTLWK
jgi:hypothetical protein